MTLNKNQGNMYELFTHTWNPIKGELLNTRIQRLSSPMRLFWQFLAIVTVFLYMGVAAHECIWTYINEQRYYYLRNYLVALRDGFNGSYHDFVTNYYYADLIEAAWITAILVIALIVLMVTVRILLYAIDKISCSSIVKLYAK